jgi:UDP-glucose 4-epimerase
VIGLLGCAPVAGQAPTPFVSDEDDVSTPELVRAIGRALGRPARLWPAPVGALRAAARVGDRVADVWSGVPWTTAAADRLFGSLTVDVTDLRQLTGYRPVAKLDDGLRSTAAWHRGLPTARHRRLGAPAT